MDDFLEWGDVIKLADEIDDLIDKGFIPEDKVYSWYS